MTSNELKELCKSHGFIAIDLSKKNMSADEVFKLAIESTEVDDIFKYNQKHEYSFARYLAIAYLDKHYSTGVIAEKVGLHHSIISYARNLDLLKCDVKYLKPWQQSATLYFRDKIEQYEKAKDEQTTI